MNDQPFYLRHEREHLSEVDRLLAEEFAERGYVIIDLGLTDDQVDDIIKQAAPLYERARNPYGYKMRVQRQAADWPYPSQHA